MNGTRTSRRVGKTSCYGAKMGKVKFPSGTVITIKPEGNLGSECPQVNDYVLVDGLVRCSKGVVAKSWRVMR